MPSAAAIEAGNAVLNIIAVDSRARSVLNEFEAELERVVGRVRNIGAAIAVAGGGALASFIAPIQQAARQQETVSRFGQVFRSETEAAAAAAARLAEEVGRSNVQIQDAFSTYQSFFVGQGFDPSVAREMTETITQLAVDLGSFNNLSTDEAIGRILSALSGSSEVLDQFGINTRAAALEQELLAQGIEGGVQAAAESEKVLARIAIITRSLGQQGAIGDAARTLGEFTNATRQAGGVVADTAAAIGQSLLPVVTPIVQLFTAVARAVRNVAQVFPGITVGVAVAAAGVAAFGVGLTGLAVAVSALLSPFTLLSISLKLISRSFPGLIARVGSAAAAMVTFRNVTVSTTLAVNGLRAATRLFLRTPLGVALQALAVIFPIVVGGFVSTATAAQRANREIEESARTAEQTRDRLGRLGQLTELGSLSDAQVAEARSLIASLGAEYQGFGASVDLATRSIVGFGEANEAVSQALESRARQGLRAELNRNQREVESLQQLIDRDAKRLDEGGNSAFVTDLLRRDIAFRRQRQEELLGRNDAIRGSLSDLGGADASGRVFTEEDIRERKRLEEQAARSRRDAEIAAIEDERTRRITQAREQAQREIAAIEEVGGNRAAIEERLAIQIATINREADQRLSQVRQRESDQRQRFEQQQIQSRRDAEIALIEDAREREIARIEERGQRDLAEAERVGAGRLAIEQRVADEITATNRRFDAQAEQQERRQAERRRRELAQEQRRRLQLVNAAQIEGSLATRALGQQFGGSTDIDRQQLRALREINRNIGQIAQRRAGLPVI